MNALRELSELSLHIILWSALFIPWICFYFLVDKAKFKTLHSVGLLVALMTVIMDVYGSSTTLWIYPTRFSPIFTLFFPVDIALLPVEAMLVVQYMPRRLWKQMVLVSAVSLFNLVLETIAVGNTAIIFYYKWRPIYSFPFYIVLFYLGCFYHGWLTKKNLPMG